MNSTMQKPGVAGEAVVDTGKPTLEEVLLCVHDCVHSIKTDTYGRAYRRFVAAIAEAYSELSVEDINEVIQDSGVAFANDHVGECDEGGTGNGKTVLQLSTPPPAQFKEAVDLARTELVQRGFEVYGSLSPTDSFDLVIYKDGDYRSIRVAVAS